MSMGGAFIAIADDANLAYFNRAGSAQLDNWEKGQSQLILTSTIMESRDIFKPDKYIFFKRTGYNYWDSLNFAEKINENWGWSLASVWGGSYYYYISPSFGFRLPNAKNISIGIGYFGGIRKSYTRLNGKRITLDSFTNTIDVDLLWRISSEWSFGVHIYDFYQLPGKQTSPDDPTYEIIYKPALLTTALYRPGIAWMPKGNLEGLIIGISGYDVTNRDDLGSTSIGFEYTPPANAPLHRHSFRFGVYNFGVIDNSSFLTIGYGYKLNDNWDIGYYGNYYYLSPYTGYNYHKLGIAVKF